MKFGQLLNKICERMAWVRTYKLFRIRKTAGNEFQCKLLNCVMSTASCVMSTAEPTFAYITYLFFFCLIDDEGPCVTSKTMLISANKATNQGLFYPFTVPISNNSLFGELKIFCLLKHLQFWERKFCSAVNLEN